MQTKFIISAVVGVIVLAGGVFMLTSKKSDNAITSMAAPSTSMLAAYECPYDDADLCKFMVGWKEVKEYSTKITMTAKGEKPSESLLEMSGANSRMTTKEDGKEIMATITIGDVDYTKDMKDGKWWKVTREKVKPNTNDTNVVKVESHLSFENNETATDTMIYKKLGKEACGKLQCFKYELIDTADKTPDTREFLLFDDKEYRLYKTRSESTGKDGRVSEMIMTYGNVHIAEPTPIKVGTQYEAAGMSREEALEIEKMMKDSQNTPTYNYPPEPNPTDYNVPPEEAPAQ